MNKMIKILIFMILFMQSVNVKAYITCNDGSKSKTCMDCHQGCCSGHQGCLKEDEKSNSNDYLKYIAYGAGATGVAGVGVAGYLAGRKSGKSQKGT